MNELNKDTIVFDEELKSAIKRVIIKLSKAVKLTLGPKGTNVGVLNNILLPEITNDGVTVVNNIVNGFKNDLDKYIANIIKTASATTENQAGDGTTTTIVLIESIVKEGYKLIDAGYSTIDVVEGIKKATEDILKSIFNKSIPVEGDILHKVATISANNDEELGKLISDAFEKVGVNGRIEVEDNHDETYVEFIDGMSYDMGYESPLFINTSKKTVEFDKCKVLIYEGKLTSIDVIIENILKPIANEQKSLIIIADDYSKEALSDLTNNKLNAGLKVCALRSAYYGSKKEGTIEDIAFISNSEIVSRRFGLEIENANENNLGELESVVITNDKISFVQKNNENTFDRIEELKEQAKSAKGTFKDDLLDRVAKLSGSVAILHVSGKTPIEITEKKYRIEDAINSTRSALEEGILPGGGVALLKLSEETCTIDSNESFNLGYGSLKKSLKAPIKTIAENSGKSGDVILNKVAMMSNFNDGYNAKNNTFGDLIELGVVDPTKVTRCALENASSVAQMILTLNCIIY